MSSGLRFDLLVPFVLPELLVVAVLIDPILVHVVQQIIVAILLQDAADVVRLEARVAIG